MFASRFQGGSHVEVFTPQGSQPLQTWRLTQGKKIGRIFDKSVKGNIIVIDGGNATRASLPKDEKSSLGLRQPFVIFQVEFYVRRLSWRIDEYDFRFTAQLEQIGHLSCGPRIPEDQERDYTLVQIFVKLCRRRFTSRYRW